MWVSGSWLTHQEGDARALRELVVAVLFKAPLHLCLIQTVLISLHARTATPHQPFITRARSLHARRCMVHHAALHFPPLPWHRTVKHMLCMAQGKGERLATFRISKAWGMSILAKSTALPPTLTAVSPPASFSLSAGFWASTSLPGPHATENCSFTANNCRLRAHHYHHITTATLVTHAYMTEGSLHPCQVWLTTAS